MYLSVETWTGNKSNEIWQNFPFVAISYNVQYTIVLIFMDINKIIFYGLLLFSNKIL